MYTYLNTFPRAPITLSGIYGAAPFITPELHRFAL